MVHSQTPILKPQNSCQQPRSRTPGTSLCHRNQYLHHTCLMFSHPTIPFPFRPATITLEWGRRSKTCNSPTAKQPHSPMKTLSSNLWIKGRPLLPSSSDCAKLIRIKIPADEVH
ncbi:unnamed protein product [Pocillopora meandrina]|uniref:Uncharacterized protein n=1 Tax=Pocillopora meandrina TaxID=46732 RepID=A0AAU9X7P6_9CNID|nr:unnamed protein product [Pocillopora meandrina]